MLGVEEGEGVPVGAGDKVGVEVSVGGSAGVGLLTLFGLKATIAPLHVTDWLEVRVAWYSPTEETTLSSVKIASYVWLSVSCCLSVNPFPAVPETEEVSSMKLKAPKRMSSAT